MRHVLTTLAATLGERYGTVFVSGINGLVVCASAQICGVSWTTLSRWSRVGLTMMPTCNICVTRAMWIRPIETEVLGLNVLSDRMVCRWMVAGSASQSVKSAVKQHIPKAESLAGRGFQPFCLIYRERSSGRMHRIT